MRQEEQQEELSECSFTPRINDTRGVMDRSIPIEERLNKWRLRKESKHKQIRKVQDVTAFLQAEKKICDCFDPLCPKARGKMLQLEGIGNQILSSERSITEDQNSQSNMFRSEISLEHKSNCSAKFVNEANIQDDDFIIENKKTSESIAKHLYKKEFARKKKERERKLKEKFVELRSYIKY